MDASSHMDRRSAGLTQGAAMTFVILLGLVSLFADMTYEGARSITGPYLAVLGASATVVGIVAGFGELIGYVLRLVAGYLSDRTGRYWTFTLVGYVVNLLAVPFLAAGRALGTRRRAHDRGTLWQGHSHPGPRHHALARHDRDGAGVGLWAARGDGPDRRTPRPADRRRRLVQA
jgi:hypothetical protein